MSLPRMNALIAIAAMAILPQHVATQEKESQFTIKESVPSTGSNIRRNAITAELVPLNKTYSELSPSEKAVIHGFYERLEPGDEPPFPAEGLKPLYETVGKAQEKLLASGQLILVAEVASTGEVTQVKALRSPDPRMTKVVAAALFATKFKPAVCSGNPCTMEYPFRFDFTVRR